MAPKRALRFVSGPVGINVPGTLLSFELRVLRGASLVCVIRKWVRFTSDSSGSASNCLESFDSTWTGLQSNIDLG